MDGEYGIPCMVRVRLVHEVDNVLPEKTQWVVIFQVKIPVQMFKNVGGNVCPFVFRIPATVYDETVSCKLFILWRQNQKILLLAVTA